MRKKQLIVLAALAVGVWLVTRKKEDQEQYFGGFTPANIFNPNGGEGQVFNFNRSDLNGGYTGTLGNVSDGNAWSMGL